ncbi:MAG: Ig-like domain-containing protein, partial [Kofleriaceae bacterium]
MRQPSIPTPRAPGLRAVALVTLTTFVTTSCGGGSGGGTPAHLGSASPISDQVLVQTKDLPDGLDLRLSNGQQGAPAFDHTKLAPAKKLGEADAAAILKRARPIASDTDDAKSFALRPGSTPAPRTGTTIQAAFPAPASSLRPPAASDAGKDLTVLRYMPEGKVPLAPELSVTFSQPMVAVTSQGDAAAITPVKLTPTPRGHWRWIGTRTILFDPEVRFPQATTYTVEIPAGTRSANGGVLKKAKTFTFETPAPSIVSSFPSSQVAQRLDAPMFVLFDQKIDPSAVLAHLKLTAEGAPFQARLLDAAELARDKTLAARVAELKTADQGAQDGRWLVFRATQPFPTAAKVVVELAAGTPSLEGPNVTKAAQSFTFHTYPPLKIEEAVCNYRNECRPGMPFVIRFNNQLDDDKFDEARIRIEPEIPDSHVVQQGATLIVQGMTAARTQYRVIVPASLVDTFGQTLGQDRTLTFDVGSAQPSFFGPSGVVVVDPLAKRPGLDFFSTNYEQLKVRLYRVTPADYDGYMGYVRQQWNHDHPPAMPGKKVFDQLVRTKASADQLIETSVDLSSALGASGLGHTIAVVEPYPWTQSYEPPRMISWVQSTQLAVDAHVDRDNLVAFVSELATGKPAAGVQLTMAPSGTMARTDDRGLATLPLGPTARGASYLTAQRGDDVAFVTDSNSWSNDSTWVKVAQPAALAWYVTDDRKMYKPGEDVSLKGWLRVIDPGKGGDVAGLAGRVTQVSYRVTDSRGAQLLTGTAPVNALGGFDAKLTLPRTPNLGYAQVRFESQG